MAIKALALVVCFGVLLTLPCSSWARFQTFGRVAVFEDTLDKESLPPMAASDGGQGDVPPSQETKTPAEDRPEEQHREEPKSEEPKPEKPKAEEPKLEEPKAEEPKQEEPKPEAGGAGSAGWPKAFPAEVLSGHEGDLEKVRTLYEIMERLAINNTIIVVPANLGFLDLALNLRCRLIDLGSSNLLIWALDGDTSRKLEEMQIPHFYDPHLYSVSGAVGYGTSQAEYSMMMSERPKVWWRILATGFDMMFLDADVVAFDAPEHAIERIADFEGQLDYQSRYAWSFENMSNASTICAGVFWLRSSAKSLVWMDHVTRSFFDRSDTHEETFRRYGHWDDQIALNFLAHNEQQSAILNPGLIGERRSDFDTEKTMGVAYMHPTKLLGGSLLEHLAVEGKGYSAQFLYNFNGETKKFRPAVVHFNGRGRAAKVDLMKEHGWWELDESLKCISTLNAVV